MVTRIDAAFTRAGCKAGVPVGLLLANGVFHVASGMDEAAFLAWGWRIRSCSASCCSASGMFIRVKIMESPRSSPRQRPLILAPRCRSSPCCATTRATCCSLWAHASPKNAFFYIFTVLVLSYGSQQLGMAEGLDAECGDDRLRCAAHRHSMVWCAVGQMGPPSGVSRWCDLPRLGLPSRFFWMLETRQTGIVIIAVVIGLIGHSAMYGPQAAFFSELFGTRVRYSGASLGYQLASPLAGGLAPLIATGMLQRATANRGPVAVYLLVMAAITIVSVWLVEETNKKSLG